MRSTLHDLARRFSGLARMALGRRAQPFAAATLAVGLAVPLATTAMTASPSPPASGTASPSTSASSTPAAGQAPYLNPGLPSSARVRGLLERMTLAEKIGQMVQIEVTQVTDPSSNCNRSRDRR